MIPSRRVYFLLMLGTLVGLAISIVGNDFTASQALMPAILLTLVWDGLVLLLMFIDHLSVRSARVQVQRQPIERLAIGRDNAIELTVQTGNRPAILQIRDFYPQTFTVKPALLDVSMPANHREDLSYTVFPSQRGEYDWGAIQMRQLGRWGLAWHQWRVPQSQTVSVYPDLIGLRALSVRLTLQNTGNLKRKQRMGMGTEFAELREYSLGDDPRLIDWKATARRSQLLMRILEPEQEQTLIILLDGGRLMTAQVNRLARFDWGMNTALALALTGLNRGDRVGLGVFDRQLHTWVPPERGKPQLNKLIEAVTPVQPTMLEPDYLNAVTTVTHQQTRRALVVLITDLVDKTASAELLSAMACLTPRYLPFCVTLRDPAVDRQAQTMTETIGSSYARAVALDLLAQRQLAFATLKQQGVLVLDAPADQVSEQLVDRYLHLKSRNQL